MISFNKDEIFIVTGASSGIGEATVKLLNELGATVVGIARNKERLICVKSKCLYPENVHIEVKDLTENIKELPNYISQLRNKYGKFQGMVCCAGISEVIPIQIVDFDKTKSMFDINYFAQIFMIKGFSQSENNTSNRASIVVISSISGLISDKGHSCYAGSKAALISSCKSLSKELINIRINCISPSEIKTPMTESKLNNIDKTIYPHGFGNAKDVAAMAAYLLSSVSSWISGQNYIFDSGYAMNPFVWGGE